jgi:Xaa-Pro aminopeptidase
VTTGQQEARASRLADELASASVDVLLVTELTNVRYLTGYTGSNGVALIGAETRAFVTDFRYVEQAADEVDPTFERHRAPRELLDLVEQLLPSGELRLGFEAEHVSFREHERLREMLPSRVELVPMDGLVEHLREVKDAGEVAQMRESARIADAALAELVDEGLIGRTEREVAFALMQKLYRHGADNPSFETIVAAGVHGALPHATPRNREIERGELVVIDWGAQVDGYCSDCTRTVAAGEPSAEARQVYDVVLQAQLAGLASVRAGADARTVDSAAREVIVAAGHGEHFGHSLGHGVGLDIHEGPRVSQRSDAVLQVGNAITVEPGIYVPERLGVRIEDLVVVSEDGCEILTSISKQLTAVD